MKTQFHVVLVAIAAIACLAGCQKTPPAGTGGETPQAQGGGHAHEGESDELFWHREDVKHEGHLVSLGQHGVHLHAGEGGEIAVAITKEGKSVEDAKVFVTVLDKDGAAELVAEQAAEYESAEGEHPAHYAVEVEKVPDAKEITVRYRITFPSAAEFKQDVPVKTEKH